MKKFEVIICVVNNGFTDLVMDAARAEGAKGGTIFHARGTGNPRWKSGITISPEKKSLLFGRIKLKDTI